jgi:ribonuclease R
MPDNKNSQENSTTQKTNHAKPKKRHKKKSKGNKIDWQDIQKLLIEIIDGSPDKFFTARSLSKSLGLKNKEILQVEALLSHFLKRNLIKQIEKGVYQSQNEVQYATGRVDYVNREFAYVICEGQATDVWVSSRRMGKALHDDTVKIKLHQFTKDNRLEGEVVEILQRAKTEFVGKVEISNRFAFVVVDSRKMFYDIFIPLDSLNGAKHNDKVVAELKHWDGADKNPTGVIKKVLGKAGENNAEIHSIMAEYGLPIEFPDVVAKQAEEIDEKISIAEIRKRRDFRHIPTFTIDPEDAKDFDDALSVQQLENGNWEIGVHIADVSHYVEPDTFLDQEAQKRATSVYLVDRVVPMLPEKLSNHVCSLRPHEEKLTFSAVFELNERATIVNQWFGRTVIKSQRRFTYDEAQQVIETQQGDFAKEILLLQNLALKTRNKRFKSGAISFESVEVKFKLDPQGKPLALVPKVRKDAHKLIEEYMLLANKLVAEYVFKKKKGKNPLTMVYRTHDEPNEEKLQNLALFAKQFGHKVELGGDSSIAKTLNQLSINVEGKPEQNVLQNLAMRAMAKAVYSTEPNQHFGLAFPHYTHFTSPIRRYPDVMVHRLLQYYLDGNESVDKNSYENKCKHSSVMEKKAADAERASIKYKQAEFMATMKNIELEGIISGVTEWGIYVEVLNGGCEGLVRLSDLDDDYYEFQEKQYAVVGRRYRRTYKLGDTIKVRVKGTDMEKRTIDFYLVE